MEDGYLEDAAYEHREKYNILGQMYDGASLRSIAISLKRIADSLCDHDSGSISNILDSTNDAMWSMNEYLSNKAGE